MSGALWQRLFWNQRTGAALITTVRATAGDLNDDGNLGQALCSGGTLAGDECLESACPDTNAIIGSLSRERGARDPTSSALTVSAHALSAITFSANPARNWPPWLLSLPSGELRVGTESSLRNFSR
jgi:hypothetical protein